MPRTPTFLSSSWLTLKDAFDLAYPLPEGALLVPSHLLVVLLDIRPNHVLLVRKLVVFREGHPELRLELAFDSLLSHVFIHTQLG